MNEPGTASDDTFTVTVDGELLCTGGRFVGETASAELKEGLHLRTLQRRSKGPDSTSGVVQISNGGGEHDVNFCGSVGGAVTVSFAIAKN